MLYLSDWNHSAWNHVVSFLLVTSKIIQTFLLVRCSFSVSKYISINRSIHLSIFHLSLCIIYIIYISISSFHPSISLYIIYITVLHLSYVLLCRKWFLSKLAFGPLDIGIVEKYLVSHEHRPPSPMFWGSFYMNRLLLGISSPIMLHFSLSLSLSHSLILSFSQSLTLSFSHFLSLSLSPSPSLSGPFVSIHFRAYAYVSSKQEKHACVIIIVHACVYHMCMCVWCTVHCAQCVMSNVQRVYNVQCNLCIIWCSVLYCHVMQRNATQ